MPGPYVIRLLTAFKAGVDVEPSFGLPISTIYGVVTIGSEKLVAVVLQLSGHLLDLIPIFTAEESREEYIPPCYFSIKEVNIEYPIHSHIPKIS